MRGKHLSQSQGWKKEGEDEGKTGTEGKDTIDTTQKGRLLCVYVCVYLYFCCKNYMHPKVPRS